MKQVFYLLIIISLVTGGFLYIQSATNPCKQVLEYSLGSFDSRFGISQAEFLEEIQAMEKVWENPIQKELFVYNPSADFKINLIFDERQQKTIAEREARQTINLKEESYEKLVAQHNSLTYQYQQSLANYNLEKADYEARLKTYNNEVNYWNKQGGASGEEFKRLNQEKKELAAQALSLEQQRISLNADANNLNALASRINEQAQKLNLDVHDYNGKFGESRQFDQGDYTGSAINVYQFNETSDLRLVIAHELGHALTIEHVEEPTAIMYYLMGQQDLDNIHLTDADQTALKAVCRIE